MERIMNSQVVVQISVSLVLLTVLLTIGWWLLSEVIYE
jgi:hypothetical protein